MRACTMETYSDSQKYALSTLPQSVEILTFSKRKLVVVSSSGS